MRIRVRLVGHLAKAGLPSGFDGGIVEIQEGASVADLLAVLRAERQAMLVTVRGRAVGREHMLSERDVVSLVPPVGGG